MYTGPHIIKDGLVFGYDTGYGIADNDTTTRFYPGRPTTNLAPSSLADWDIESGAAKTATGNYYNGQPTYNCRAKVGQSWVGIYKTISNLRTTAGSSGTVTVSCFVKNTNSSSYPLYAHIGHDFSSTRTIAANSDWQRIQWTVNQSSMGSDYVEFRPYTNNASIYLEMTMPQVEDNVGTATPWTETSRSSTASLIDLKETTDIDVGDVSFDSTGQPTFDGTDDILNTGQFSGVNPSTQHFTIEAIVKSDTTSGNHMWVDATGNGTNQRLYCAHASTGSSTPLGIQNSGWSHSIPQDTNYHHYVITMNGSTAQLYNNSVAHSNKSYTSYTLSGQINVGGRGGYRWNGDIPVFKIYNRVLTAAEIKQNFNAYKNRFDI